MSKKQKIIASVVSAFALLSICVFSLTFSGCSGGGNYTGSPNAADESMGPNGVRKDIEAYVQGAYPDSAKKRAALTSYAKYLQAGYDKAMDDPSMTKEDAVNIDSQKIRALNCLRLVGGLEDNGDPVGTVAKMTTYSSDRNLLLAKIAAREKYESFFSLAIIPVSSSSDTIENACDFDVNSLPN